MKENWFLNWNEGKLLAVEYFLPLILVFLLIAWWDRARQKDKLDAAFSSLRSMTILYVGVVAYLWLNLPSSFIVDNSSGTLAKLETSGLPQDLLVHLEENNSALVRLLEIVHWFLFFTCAWFVAETYSFLSILKETKSKAIRESA